MSYLIDMLIDNGITEIVLLLGYLPKIAIDYLEKNLRPGINFRYMVGDIDWETGTRVKRAEHLLDDHFLLMYSDNFWELNLRCHLEAYRNSMPDLLMTVYANFDNYSKSNVCFDPRGNILFYDKTRSDPDCNGIDIGFFVFSRKLVRGMPAGNFHLTHDYLPGLIQEKRVRCVPTSQVYYSIGSLDRLPKTERYLARKKVVLLDRDGVINKKAAKADYIKSVAEFRFLPGVLESIALLTKHGYQIYVISNQAGIARGIMSEADLEAIHVEMVSRIGEAGGEISGIYYCPHGWDDNCACRKPKPGMLHKASRDHEFRLAEALFIGDDERDEEAGIAAGCKTILTREGFGLPEVAKSVVENGPDYAYLLYRLLKLEASNARKIVAIAGQSRSGKSSLAKKLGDDLSLSHGIPSQVFQLDNFIISIEKRSGDSTVRSRFDYPAIAKAIEAIHAGESLAVPRYDHATRRSSECGDRFVPALNGIVFIDGVVSLDAIGNRGQIDLSVFIQVDEKLRRERMVDFYKNEKKLSDKEVENLIEERYKDEFPIIANTIQSADLLIRN